MSALTPTQDISIPTRIIGEDMAIYLSDAEVLVSSKSEPNRWRIVDLMAHTCTCPGFSFRGNCRHICTANVAAEIERREAVAVLPEYVQPAAMYPSTCPPTKEPWLPDPAPRTTDYHCAECGRVQPMPRLAGAPFGWVDRDPQHVSAGLICDRCVMADALMEYDPERQARTGFALND